MKCTSYTEILGAIIPAFAILFLSPDCRAGSVVAQETFSTAGSVGSPDGWTSSNDPQSQITNPLKDGNTGGPSDGYARFKDNAGTTTFLVAPANSAFLGDYDLTKLQKTGVISFDHKIFDSGPDSGYAHFEVELIGRHGSALWTGPVATAGSNGVSPWVTVVAPLYATSDWVVTSNDPNDPTTFANILHDVTGLEIRMELVSNPGGAGADIEGIDNIYLEAIPEPGSLTLAGIGCLAASFRTWRLWRKRLLAAAC
jgi:hypothetical protein